MQKVQYLQSKLLLSTGIQHGWFMRYGGVSAGLFESLNGKKGSGDTGANVDENRRRALAALCHPELVSGSGDDQPKILKQVQDDTMKIAHIIHTFKNGVLDAKRAGEFPGFDASVTVKPGLVLSQTTADCGTIIIADTKGTVVSLVHGSWHTLSAKIICDVVAKIKGYTTEELIAGLGPMICQNCYEFGPEAAQTFEPQYLKQSGQKYLVDLRQIIKDQLAESGITKIDDVNVCTLEDSRFFSHRRSGAHSGRFLTLASLTDVV